jgi:hypothetical protein
MIAGKPGISGQCTFLEYRPLDDAATHRIVGLLIILGTLFMLDIVTTQIILWVGGAELNPLMTGIVLNPALHLGIKAAILLIIFIVSLVAEKQVRGSSVVFYCTLISLYFFIVFNNIVIILPRIAT